MSHALVTPFRLHYEHCRGTVYLHRFMKDREEVMEKGGEAVSVAAVRGAKLEGPPPPPKPDRQREFA